MGARQILGHALCAVAPMHTHVPYRTTEWTSPLCSLLKRSSPVREICLSPVSGAVLNYRAPAPPPDASCHFGARL